MSRAVLLAVAALASIAAGVALVRPYVPETTPRAANLARLAGPLRGLPVPFLWTRIAEAAEQQNTRAHRSPAWLLSVLMPEQPELVFDLALRRIYGDGALARDATERAAALADGLALLDEAAAIHPDDGTALAWQGFHLITRCADMDGAAECRAAFEALTGVDPLQLAEQRLAEASRRATGIDWSGWMRATALEFLAATELASGSDRDVALRTAARLREASRLWQEVNPARAAQVMRFATGLSEQPMSLSADDLDALKGDPVFGHKARSWLRRFQKKQKKD